MTTKKDACPFPGSSIRRGGRTGRGCDAKGEPVEIEGTGFFARMLQHEVGHLDGFLYVDVLIGRNARAAKKAIKRAGWGKPGLSWIPGTVSDPFGHEDD